MGKKRKGRLREFQRKDQEVSTMKTREERQERIKSKKAEQSPSQVKKKKKKKKLNINKSNIIIAFVIVLLAFFIGISAKNIIQLKIEQNHLQQQNQALTEEKQNLQKELDDIGKRKYIEQQARELLKMVKPNEKLFVIDSEDD